MEISGWVYGNKFPFLIQILADIWRQIYRCIGSLGNLGSSLSPRFGGLELSQSEVVQPKQAF